METIAIIAFFGSLLSIIIMGFAFYFDLKYPNKNFGYKWWLGIAIVLFLISETILMW